MHHTESDRWSPENIARESKMFVSAITQWKPIEVSIPLENIKGKLPKNLTGTLLRNGPACFYRSGRHVRHLFDGDGMIAKWSFEGTRVHFTNCYVQTKTFRKETRHDRFLFARLSGFDKKFTWKWPRYIWPKNIANTNIIHWHENLYALWEGGNPHRLKQADLSTLAQEKIHNRARFSAHPKIEHHACSKTTLINFGIKLTIFGTRLSIFESQAGMQARLTRSVHLPGFVYAHDFAITKDYYVFYVFNLSVPLFAILSGKKSILEALSADTKRQPFALFIDRHGKNDIRIPLPNWFVMHHANAYQEGHKITVDSFIYDRFSAPLMDLKAGDSNMHLVAPAQLHRVTFNLEKKSYEIPYAETQSSDFPALHPKYIGKTYRYLYGTTSEVTQHYHSMAGIYALDWETKNRTVWYPGPFQFVTEPCFAPDPSCKSDQEDAGWLLSALIDVKKKKVSLIILDPKQVDRGPIAELPLPHFILPGLLHGSFTSNLTLNKDE